MSSVSSSGIWPPIHSAYGLWWEYVRVAQFMMEHSQREVDGGSVITGRSVQNQRIERFWRDLFLGCIGFSMIFSISRKMLVA